jgi:hypothetical protein
MRILGMLLLVLITSVCLFGSIHGVFSRTRECAWRQAVRKLSWFLIGYGGLAFCAQPLAALAGPSFTTASFEWPVGFAGGVVRDARGRYVVPLDPCNRIQVYDRDDKFLKGWFVDPPGKVFRLRIADGDRIEALGSRGEKLVYSGSGELLKRESYDRDAVGQVPQEGSTRRWFPTAWLLLPFAHPVIAWLTAMVGMWGQILLERRPGTEVPSRNRCVR